MTNIVIGGLIEKENIFLLVQEAKEKCKENGTYQQVTWK